jgi:hypothetical protein
MTETKTGNDIDRKNTIGEWKLLWIGLIVICLCIVLGATSQSKSFHAKSKSRKAPSPPSSPAPTGATEAGPVWGTLFNGAVSSNQFPKLGCEFNDKKICCSAMESVAKKNKKPKNPLHHHCSLVKKYFPSPYEKRHLEVAEELAKIPELHNRTIKFIEFIESSEEIDHTKRWLDRVATRQQGIPLTENDIDREYLSRFRVTRKCSNNAANHSWWEYIEPLSVHARHPFGLGECWHPHFHEEARVYNGTAAPNASLLAVDYLLLQTPSDLTGHASATSVEQQGRHSPRSSSFPHEVFLFDAGTSRFDSSLFWFICAYQQVPSLSSPPSPLTPYPILSPFSWAFSLITSLAGNLLSWNQLTFGIMFQRVTSVSIASSMLPSLPILPLLTLPLD